MSTSDQGSSGAATTSYDAVPYPSGSFPQSHPNRIGAIARLFGINAAAPSSARVLELGCADGSNLLPIADNYRGSKFLGIDASKIQIAAGQRALAASGLTNVELRAQNILEFGAAEGKFDYILVHGIYSWVPEPVRQKILEICSTNLAENGVAYVSYNALPGWNMRRSLRDMALFHTAALKDPKAKAQQLRALLKFLADSVPTENNAYGLYLKSELAGMAKQRDDYLLHDILEEENTAFYLYEFATRAAKRGLQYLGEPSLSQMLAANFPEKVTETLNRVGSGVIAQEQYMDFLRNRTFRQTLLCHATRPLSRQVQAGAMRGFAFQSQFKRPETPVDLTPDVSVSFVGTGGTTINASDAFVKAILKVLTDVEPGAIAYQDLLKRTRQESRSHFASAANRDAVDEATLQSNLLMLCSKGFVELYAEPVDVSTKVPKKPKLSPLVRYQAMNSRMMSSRLHASVPADVFVRYVMEACDGSRDAQAIESALVAQVLAGKLNVKEKEQPVTDEKTVRQLLGPQVQGILKRLTELGFFGDE